MGLTEDSRDVGGWMAKALREGNEIPITWTYFKWEGLILSVTADAVMMDVEGYPLRMPVSYEETIEVCQARKWLTPTYDMGVTMYQQAVHTPEYVGLVSTQADTLKMKTLGFCAKFNNRLNKALPEDREPDQLIYGPWKNWILDQDLKIRGAVNHGFWTRFKNGKPCDPYPIQKKGPAHDAKHYDYSQQLTAILQRAVDAETGEEVNVLDRITNVPEKYLAVFR